MRAKRNRCEDVLANQKKEKTANSTIWISKKEKLNLLLKVNNLKMINKKILKEITAKYPICLLYTSPSPRDRTRSRMPSSA